MDNNSAANKLSEYIDQHIAIVTFLIKEHKKLTEMIFDNPNDGVIILEFMSRMEELIPYYDKYGDFLEKGEDIGNVILDSMGPIDIMRLLGTLADIIEISDVVMGVYLKHYAKGGSNE